LGCSCSFAGVVGVVGSLVVDVEVAVVEVAAVDDHSFVDVAYMVKV
jgi:hypothetical protein